MNNLNGGESPRSIWTLDPGAHGKMLTRAAQERLAEIPLGRYTPPAQSSGSATGFADEPTARRLNSRSQLPAYTEAEVEEALSSLDEVQS